MTVTINQFTAATSMADTDYFASAIGGLTRKIPRSKLYADLVAMSGVPFAFRYEGSAVPVVANGAAVTTWPASDSFGTAMGSGVGVTYINAANGLDGNPGVQGSPSAELKTASGGTRMNSTGGYYMAAVIKTFTTTDYQNFCDFGDVLLVGDERSILRNTPSGGAKELATDSFGDFVAGAPLVSQLADNTAYFVEANCDGTTVYLYVNGNPVGVFALPVALRTFTEPVARLFRRKTYGQVYTGAIYSFYAINALATIQQRQTVLDYVNDTYPSLNTGGDPYVVLGSGGAARLGALSDRDAVVVSSLLPLVVGGSGILKADSGSLSTQGTGWTVPAVLTVYGPLVADTAGVSGVDHTLITDGGQDGSVLTLYNRVSTATSGLRFMVPGSGDQPEGGIFGVAVSAPEARTTGAGSLYWMATGGAANQTNGGSYRGNQQAFMDGVHFGVFNREEWCAADASGAHRPGDHLFYGLDWANSRTAVIAQRTYSPTEGWLEETTASGIAATGNSSATAPLVTSRYNEVTTGTAVSADGVRLEPGDTKFFNTGLPSGTPRTFLLARQQTVFNRTSITINVYPPSGQQIDGAGSDVPKTMLAGTKMTFVHNKSASWESIVN